MQVGITKMVMGDQPLADFFEQAAVAGYEVVELSITRDGELTPQTPENQLHEIRGQAEDAGLRIVSLTHSHCTGNLLDDGEAQETSVAETIAGLRIADAMDVRCTLHTLGRQRPDLYYDDAYHHGVAAMRRIGDEAGKLKIDVAIEFTWMGFGFSPLEMRRFLDDIDRPRIGFYFDPGNMAVFQYPHHWVRIVGPHIKMVHLKDWRGGALNGTWPPLLEGDVDYTAMNRELRAIGYDGPMISEVDPNVASLEKTAEAIRRIIEM